MRDERGTRGSGTRWLAGVLAATFVLLGAIPNAQGQKSTEQFIPMGQSPGLSGKYTSMGEIVDVNARDQTITIADRAGPRTVKISLKTRIFLDRSKLKRSNLTGRFGDLQKGRRVEVKYVDPRDRAVADWVKVEVSG